MNIIKKLFGLKRKLSYEMPLPELEDNICLSCEKFANQKSLETLRKLNPDRKLKTICQECAPENISIAEGSIVITWEKEDGDE